MDADAQPAEEPAPAPGTAETAPPGTEPAEATPPPPGAGTPPGQRAPRHAAKTVPPGAPQDTVPPGTPQDTVPPGTPQDTVPPGAPPPPGAGPTPPPGAGTGGDGPSGTRPESKRSGRWIIELVAIVVVAVVVAVLLRTYVVATFSIPSGSMEPTLQVGDRIVVDKLSYHLHSVDTGNIIVFSTPPTENCAGPPVSDLVKRVIGLPGQTVSLSNGRVYINGHLLLEPWLPVRLWTETYPGPSAAPYSLHHPYRVPAGDVYVMGDNRTESCDSRYWGPVRESTIVGKVDLRIWPLSRLGIL